MSSEQQNSAKSFEEILKFHFKSLTEAVDAADMEPIQKNTFKSSLSIACTSLLMLGKIAKASEAIEQSLSAIVTAIENLEVTHRNKI